MSPREAQWHGLWHASGRTNNPEVCALLAQPDDGAQTPSNTQHNELSCNSTNQSSVAAVAALMFTASALFTGASFMHRSASENGVTLKGSKPVNSWAANETAAELVLGFGTCAEFDDDSIYPGTTCTDHDAKQVCTG
jgi:hypothetical protein